GEDAGKAASRLHARIELKPAAAWLLDTGSANKTLLNDKPVGEPALLRPGDQIQIGFTGATLVVLDFVLPLRSPVGRRRIGPRAFLSMAGGLIACLLLLAGVHFWLYRLAIEPSKILFVGVGGGLIGCLLLIGLMRFWPRSSAPP